MNVTLSRMIDHTLLKASATVAEIEKVCAEALQYGFASVCVNSSYIRLVSQKLDGSKVKPICVVGFPLGAMATECKIFETQFALNQGAQEIDMVMDVGAAKSGNWQRVQNDIEAVVQTASPFVVKVILEIAYLTPEEITKACLVAKASRAAFVKTSTGFAPSGATVEAVSLMRKTVGSEIGVKASGGIRTTEDAEKMIAAGANRLGTSNSVEIVLGQKDVKSESQEY